MKGIDLGKSFLIRRYQFLIITILSLNDFANYFDQLISFRPAV